MKKRKGKITIKNTNTDSIDHLPTDFLLRLTSNIQPNEDSISYEIRKALYIPIKELGKPPKD